jgi:hypothetical protein
MFIPNIVNKYKTVSPLTYLICYCETIIIIANMIRFVYVSQLYNL